MGKGSPRKNRVCRRCVACGKSRWVTPDQAAELGECYVCDGCAEAYDEEIRGDSDEPSETAQMLDSLL